MWPHDHRSWAVSRAAGGREADPLAPRARAQQAATAFAELQPVKVTNCELARYGRRTTADTWPAATAGRACDRPTRMGFPGTTDGAARFPRAQGAGPPIDCFNTTKPGARPGKRSFIRSASGRPRARLRRPLVRSMQAQLPRTAMRAST